MDRLSVLMGKPIKSHRDRRHPKVIGVPQVHDHPILLSDNQVALLMNLPFIYEMHKNQHSNKVRAEWGSVACDVIKEVFYILGIHLPDEVKESFHKGPDLLTN